MAAAREGEVFCRDFPDDKGLVEFLTIAGRDDMVINGVGEVSGRGLGCDVELVGIEFYEILIGGGAKEVFARSLVGSFSHRDDGIDENGEVRPAALALNGVGAIVIAKIVFGGGHGGEVTSGREANNANLIRLEIPISRALASHADGVFDVGKGTVGIAFWKSVIEDDSRDSVSVQPFGDGSALSFDHSSVATAGGDDKSGAVWLLGAEDGDGGLGILESAVAEWSFPRWPEFDRLGGLLGGESRGQSGGNGDGCLEESFHFEKGGGERNGSQVWF